MITLYELAGADPDRRFSPYCWRIHLALLHKGLEFRTLPWRFTDKQVIAFSGSEKVPVLTDGDRVLHDSPVIADYLEQAYPDHPSLFGGETAQALSRFVMHWNETVLQPRLFRLLALDIHRHLASQDLAYFRQSREARIGQTLEQFCCDPAPHLAEFQALLTPFRRTLGSQPYLSGSSPAWADYVMFGLFQWARCVSPLQLLQPDDAVFHWRERMLDLFDGAARRAVGFDVI